MMVKAVRIHRVGGPEVLTYEDISVGAPDPAKCAYAMKPSGSISSTSTTGLASIRRQADCR